MQGAIFSDIDVRDYKGVCCTSSRDFPKEFQLPNYTLNKIKNLISKIHQNFLITCDLILTKISIYIISIQHSFWLSKIQNIILSKRSHRINRDEHWNTLKKNNEYITTIFRSIFVYIHYRPEHIGWRFTEIERIILIRLFNVGVVRTVKFIIVYKPDWKGL